MKLELTENDLTNLIAVCDQEDGKQAERLSERCKEALVYGGGITIGRAEMTFNNRDLSLLKERFDPDMDPDALRTLKKILEKEEKTGFLPAERVFMG